jgi:hypothetical protein
MALSITVDISKAALKAPAEVARRVAVLRGAALNRQIGRGVAGLFSDHFRYLDATRPNALGGNRTHFYGDAAKAVSSDGDNEGATITVAQQGIRQRLQGGTIRPGAGKKYLTIPARAEAYGRRAREFHDLKFVKLKNGRGMLVAGELTGLTGKMNKKGEVVERPGTEDGVVMYWLVPSVVQKADPSVLPPGAAIRGMVQHVIDQAFYRNSRRPS